MLAGNDPDDKLSFVSCVTSSFVIALPSLVTSVLFAKSEDCQS
jgi:hypothetical protein